MAGINLDFNYDLKNAAKILADAIDAEYLQDLMKRQNFTLFEDEFRQTKEYPDFPSGIGWVSPSTRKNSR